MTKILKIGGEAIRLGQRKTIQLEMAKLYDFTEMKIPVHVIRGKEDGPTMFISAAIHGDEINGVEIIKRVLKNKSLKNIKGTLILVPVVNVFGFNTKSRYLPDRRDLNRSFPGSAKGSLASRMARLFMKEIVSKCTHGIDLHTGAIHRTNLPQIRASLVDKKTLDFAKAFKAPIIIDSNLRDGSLREAAKKKKVTMLLFEGGEALRFEEGVIKCGVNGCIKAMRSIGMLPPLKKVTTKIKPSIVTKDSYWVRTPSSGTCRMLKKMGDYVRTNEKICVVSDLLGQLEIPIYAPEEGVMIGENKLPLVNQGDALVHIATSETLSRDFIRKTGGLLSNLYGDYNL